MTCPTSLPPHGRMPCSACFSGPVEWGKTIATSADGWALENNPCAWGTTNPRYLLLGFSKGLRQTANILGRRHDDIPYAGFRPRLTQGLRLLGLLAGDDTIERHIRADEPDWAFGSVVRCGMAKDGRSSGTIIPESSRAGSHERWFDNCTALYLRHLPPRLETVVMLSNSDAYVDDCFSRIKRLHPGTQRINDVCYGDDKVLWVHTVHFGGTGFNHMNSWLSGGPGKAGDKGRQAVAAVAAWRSKRSSESRLTR